MAKYFSKFPKTLYSLANNNLDIVTNITTRFSFEKNLKENLAAFYNYEIRDGDTPEILASKIYGSPERHWIILSFNNIIDPQFDWPLNYSQLNEYIALKYSVVTGVSIVQGGTGYSNGYIRFETTDKRGKGANASFTVNTSTGAIETVTLFNPGSGYVTSPSYFISSNGQGAVLSVNTTTDALDWSKNNIKTYYKVEKQTTEDGTVTTKKYEISQNTYVNLQESVNTIQLYDNKSVQIETIKEYINYYDYELEENEKKRSISILRSELVNDLENELKGLFQ